MTAEADIRVQNLKQHGYVVFQLMTPDDAQAAKQHVYNLERAGVGSRNNIQHRIAELIPAGGQLMAQLVCHPSLLQVLHRYLGSKYRLATFSSNTLLPQDGSLGSGLGWHPDYPYHDIDQPWPPPEFPLGCQVLICLDEFRQDNGGTMFMPNSHMQKPEGIEDDIEGTSPGSITLTASAGSVLIAHSAWWHRQTKNVSKLPRTALLGNYTPGHVVPKDNMEKQWHVFKASGSYLLLSKQEQETLEKLLLGPHTRGLYASPPQP
ncbi:TPA: hypothetical protein ACH3X1_008473 [Trebouxia sp. C0004]